MDELERPLAIPDPLFGNIVRAICFQEGFPERLREIVEIDCAQ